MSNKILNIDKQLILESLQDNKTFGLLQEDAFSEKHPIMSWMLKTKERISPSKAGQEVDGPTPEVSTEAVAEAPGFIQRIGQSLIPGVMKHNDQVEQTLSSL